MIQYSNIAIADDHHLILEGFELCLKEVYGNITVWKAKNKVELIDILRNHPIEVLFQDVLFGDHDARTFINDLKVEFGQLKIVIISTLSDTSTVNTLLKQGVHGYISKADDSKELINAMEALANDKVYLSPDVLSSAGRINPNKNVFVTKREEAVLSLIVKGYTSKEIADQLNVSIKTIETHRANLFARFAVKNVVELVTKAIFDGYS